MQKRTWTLLVIMLVTVAVGGSQAFAAEGDWMVRGRLLVVDPNASSTGTLNTLDVDGNFTVEVDVNYFFTDHIAIEAIAATTSHTVTLRDSDTGSLVDLGSASLLPPTVLLQYHFLPDGSIRPYIGAGINYTMFYEQSGALADLDDLDNSFGFAAQFGIDFMINDTVSFNVDVKYIDMSTEVSSNGTKLADLTIDPMVFGFGVGWRF